MKHTKGKWEVDEIRGCKVVVCGSMVIASDLFDENEEPSIEELDANANLIASAPEMLEMLKICALQLPDETAEEVLQLIDETEGNEKNK